MTFAEYARKYQIPDDSTMYNIAAHAWENCEVAHRIGRDGLPLLYTPAKPQPGELQIYPGLRLASPSEIGAKIEHLSAGSMHVRVGSIDIVANNPALEGINKPGLYSQSFLIGRDATVKIDGQDYEDRTGLRLSKVAVEIEHNKPLFVRIEGTPKI